ncbi:MAG TPA: 3-isopropylmalate dehydratase large subunit [Candidatus Brocadiia bacterium]|nr:3-isopropylmalate dehydratase large subunit [Candidatus Brocadiia bacterium]
MGMTISQKILAAHCGADAVQPDQLIMANVDICLGNDITAPIAIQEFEAHGFTKVFDPERVVLVPDHFTPNKDIKSADQAKQLRDFARKHGLKHYFEVGRMGVEHALLPEQGIVVPGDLIIGADSHTCTYGALGAFSTGVGSTDLAAAMASGKVWLRVPHSMKFIFAGKPGPWTGGKDFILHTIGKIGVSGALYRAMEFTGPAIHALDMDNRLSLCNMAIEAGAKAGVIEADDITRAYVKGRGLRPAREFFSDVDAVYAAVTEFNVNGMGPLVALPHLPENVKPVEECRGMKIDQVVIGSCTNGRIEDLRVAARILKGRKTAATVRLIVIPATQAIYQQAMKEGLLDIFIEAEAAVSTPTCGPCLGGHMGILAAGERALATTNRNFVGRMGHPKSEVCLCGPAVAAASAVTGAITHPADVVGAA